MRGRKGAMFVLGSKVVVVCCGTKCVRFLRFSSCTPARAAKAKNKNAHSWLVHAPQRENRFLVMPLKGGRVGVVSR